MLCSPPHTASTNFLRKSYLNLWLHLFRRAGPAGLACLQMETLPRMLWSGDPNKPICKLAGGIDPVEIKGLTGEHFKKLLSFLFFVFLLLSAKAREGKKKKIKLIKIVLNEVRHNSSILKQQLPRRLLKQIFTSCFSLSFFLACFKPCSVKSLLNYCWPHYFQFLNHDFSPVPGEAPSPNLQTGRFPKDSCYNSALRFLSVSLQKRFNDNRDPKGPQRPLMGDLTLGALVITQRPISTSSQNEKMGWGKTHLWQ